jgi:hypothetical protein
MVGIEVLICFLFLFPFYFCEEGRVRREFLEGRRVGGLREEGSGLGGGR